MIKLYSILTLLILGSSLLSCTSDRSSTKSSPSDNKPNIIFFIADDMYPEMFNCLPQGKGKNLTPNLDRLASEGVLLTDTYVASPVCTPSRYNCLTGNYASKASNKEFLQQTENQEGQTVIHWNTFITSTDKSIAHYMKELGYATGMAGKNHVIEVNGLYKFPDYWADARNPDIMEKIDCNYELTVQAILSSGFDYAGGIYHNNPNFVGLGELAVQNMDWIAEAGVDFIEKNHSNPFFLYFATTIPHQPSQPERSWKADPLITASGYLEEAPSVLPARATLAERTQEAGLEGKNKENLLWLDDAIGALMNKLEEHGILDNTIIFFFNDHGQRAKGTLYQGGVLSPSIVWKKDGFPCGSTCDTKIQNIDFAPTILDLAGGTVAEGEFDGQSFKSSLEKNAGQVDRAMYFELGYARAIIKGDYKYYAIRYPQFAENMTEDERAEVLEAYNEGRRFRNMKIVNEDDPLAPFSHFSLVPGGEQAENESYGKLPAYFDRDQLYNIKLDPFEQRNLISDEDHEEIFGELKKELLDHLSTMPGRFDL